MSRLPKLNPTLKKNTLSRELVLRTTLLVALVTVALSGFSAFASFQILQRELDDQLLNAAERGLLRNNDPAVLENCDTYGAGLIRLQIMGGQAVTLDCPVQPTEKGWQQLADVPIGVAPYTMHLDGVGAYRVYATIGMKGMAKIVVAMPYSEVSNPMAQQVLSMVLLTIGSIMVSFVGTSKVVEYSLAPLNRLTDTATHVSTLPLASGTGKVDIRFADPSVAAESEVGRVGLAFNHMLDNVEGALTARHASETKVRRFVADASHELRNPLAAIRGYSELAKRSDAGLPEDTAHAIRRINSEAERMSALVNDLLLLARLDSEPDVQILPTDITEIVLNAVSDAQVSGTDHNWVLQIPEAELVVPGNAAQLHQVVVNLLANARTHTPPGTTVTTALQAVAGAVLLTVADDGPGVPEELKLTAFDRFSRADSSRSRLTGAQSTGLGLAIVAAVVAAHHGRVTLESQPGRTVFAVWLPAAPPPPPTPLGPNGDGS